MADDYLTISEFLCLAGFTRSWINQLWMSDRGPPRETLHIGGRTKVRLPLRPAILWLKGRYPERFKAYTRIDDLLHFDEDGNLEIHGIRERQR